MTCVAKKIVTLPFGAELPPDLIVSLDELVSRRGWTKKRALAAAVRRLLLADRVDQDDWYEMAYDPIEPDCGTPSAPSPTRRGISRRST